MTDSKTIRVGRIGLMRCALALLSAPIGLPATAQPATPATNATMAVNAVGAAASAPSEAAQRQALGPYRMILRSAAMSSKPRAAAPTAAATNSTPSGTVSRAPNAKRSTEADQPASEAPALPSTPTAVTPDTVPAATAIATPTVQAIEAPVASRSEAATPPPAPLAALTSAPRDSAPAAAVAKTALIFVKNDPPVLSGPLARESPSGTVRVTFNVNPDGSTSDFKIASSSNRRLNNPVLAAVSKWRYQPIDAVQTTEVEMVFSAE
jgi:TonB family protein